MPAMMIAASLVFIGSAQAAGDAAKERQAVMKQNGAAIRALAQMAKGQTPFDAAAAQLAMRTMNTAALGFGYMFPEGSETGSKTRAAPAIWSDRAGFDAAVAKYIAATSVTISDLGGLKAAMGAVGPNCGSCHKAYRTE
ncbi:MAG: cytochrome C556 [Rhizobiaceae bacterium]|nr:cytochrome C556 [Rhizobiaceae bacterium]